MHAGGMRTPVSHYSELISDLTGVPADTAVLVEELMRGERTALDSMTVPEFERAAHDALREARELEQLGMLGDFCDALQIPVPARLSL